MRQALLKDMRVVEAAEGTVIIRQGEKSDAAYFILNGSTFAGQERNGLEHILEVHAAGDFFGEIGALTSMPRTANVVASQPTELLRVTATSLREMHKIPALNRIFLSKMTERMVRLEMIELPKRLAYDQSVLRELRTVEPEVGD